MWGKTRRYKIRNDKIRDVEVISVLRKADVAQLRWLGHPGRMDEERISKRRWEWTPIGNRPRGKPKKRRKDAVKDSREVQHARIRLN